MRGRGRIMALGSCFAIACSLTTDFSGLTGGDGGEPSADAGAGDADAASGADATPDAGSADASADTSPAGPRAWSRVDVTGPPARHSAKMIYEQTSQRILLFGGQTETSTVTDETWAWDGAAWTQLSPPTSAPARRGFGFAYSGKQKVALAYAGEGVDPAPNLWRWDGSVWSQVVPSLMPASYKAPGFVYDDARDVFVLFGGDGGSTTSAQTWEFDGTTWTKRSPATSPPPRGGHCMAYDSARKRTVVVAGRNGNTDLNDTWEYDGNNWSLVSTTGLGARHGACCAYDAGRHVTVLFGGGNGGSTPTFPETYLWDGKEWSFVPRTGDGGPPGRRSCALAYDGARDALLLYGGTLSESSSLVRVVASDTWTFR